MSADLTFGSWLKRRRQGLGITQKELARRIGYAEVTVRKTEADERRPSREMAERLAEHLEIDPNAVEDFIRFARDQPGWVEFALPSWTAEPTPEYPESSLAANAGEEAFGARPRFLGDESADPPGIFVGREAELARLDEFLEAALAGSGQFAFVTGEAGSGKSSLLNAFARHALQQHGDLIAAFGTCDMYAGAGDPYVPFREVMATLSGDIEARWASGHISRRHALRTWQLMPHVVDVLVSRGPDLLETFVSRRDLLARASVHELHQGAWRERLEMLATRGRGPDQSRLFEEYADVLLTFSGEHPLLLLLDDLHWADMSSLGLLFHLARAIVGSRILIVGAYRPEEAVAQQGLHSLYSVVSEIQGMYGNVRISLDNSEQGAASQFVTDLLDNEPNVLDEEFRQALLARGRGHPLFTVELLRDLQDRGALTRDELGRWKSGPDLTWDTVPARVEGVIEQRIGRLKPNLREVLTVASVVGETFASEVVAKVTRTDQREVVHWLSTDLQRIHRLVHVEGIQEVGTKRLSLYRFNHILFQLYLYQNLDEVERSYLHEAVGHALEEIYRAQEEFGVHAGMLARHFEEAHMADKASQFRLRAGEYAARISAHQEAITQFNKGLELIAGMPPTPSRERQALALHLALAVSITTTQGYAHPKAYTVYERSRSIATRYGDDSEIFQAMYGLWRYAVMGAKLDEAEEIGRELMNLARETQVSGQLVEAHRAVGVNLFHVGKFTMARSVLEDGIALYDPQAHGSHAYQFGHDPALSCLAYLSHTLCILGELDTATARLHDLVHLAWELGHPFSLAYSQCFGAANCCQLRQDVDGVLRWANEGLSLARRRGFPFWIAQALILRGWATATQGAGPSSINEIRKGLATWRNTGARALFPYFEGLLGEAYLATGDIGAGLTVIDEGLAAAEQTGERYFTAELHRIRGQLLLSKGMRVAAEDALRQALETARDQEARTFEDRALTSLNNM